MVTEHTGKTSAKRTGLRSYEDVKKVKTIQDFCKDTFISLKNDYVYLSSAKAAHSNVLGQLQRAELAGANVSLPSRSPNDIRSSVHILPYQLKEEHVVELLNSEKIKNVAFVRNPYSRLLSCFLHRIKAPNKPNNPSVQTLYKGLKWPKKRSVNFDTFIRFVCDQETNEMERHWIVQYDSLFFGLLDYAFVGTAENFSEDMRRLERLIFNDKVFVRDGLDRSPLSTSASTKVAQYYTAELAQKVAERYALDFEAFGYAKELPGGASGRDVPN